VSRKTGAGFFFCARRDSTGKNFRSGKSYLIASAMRQKKTNEINNLKS
jgi:hypothetical protein